MPLLDQLQDDDGRHHLGLRADLEGLPRISPSAVATLSTPSAVVAVRLAPRGHARSAPPGGSAPPAPSEGFGPAASGATIASGSNTVISFSTHSRPHRRVGRAIPPAAVRATAPQQRAHTISSRRPVQAHMAMQWPDKKNRREFKGSETSDDVPGGLRTAGRPIPEGFWMRAAEAIDWIERADQGARRQPRAALRLVPRRGLQHLLERRRPPRRGRPRRPRARSSTTRRSPARRRASPMPSCATGWRGSPARWRRAGWARATGSSSTCRWCPRRWSRCWPAPGSARSIRWSSAASPRPSSRCASTTRAPKAIIAASCGHRAGAGRRLQAAGRRGDRAWRAHKPDFCRRPAARRRRRPSSAPGATSTGTRRRTGVGARALRAGRRHGPALHPLHLGHHRPAEGRGARRPPATWSRSPGRCRTSTRIDAGRGLLGGLRRRLGRRAFLHLLRAAARRRDDGRLRGQAGRHARRRHLLAGDRRASGEELLHRADGLPRDQARGPGGQADRRLRPQLRCATCSSPASGPIPTPSPGRERHLKVPVIDHWWQTETGWAIAANPAGIELLPVKPGSPTVPMPGYDVQILSEAGDAAAAGRARRRRDQAAAAAGHAADALERRRAVRRSPTSRASPATTRPATPG